MGRTLASKERQRFIDMGEVEMRKRSLIVAASCAVVFAAFGPGSAFAGESGGNGKRTPIGAASDAGGDPHASSICSFSGQNPEGLLDPSDPNFEPGRTQSWGQIPKDQRDVLRAEGSSPGDACNGHTGFFAGGGEE
jgi:hypothetical protein